MSSDSLKSARPSATFCFLVSTSTEPTRTLIETGVPKSGPVFATSMSATSYTSILRL